MTPRFVWITGFPRSGTTWLFKQLRKSACCESVGAEQGLDYIWTHRTTPVDIDPILSRTATDADAHGLVLAGMYLLHHAQWDAVRLIDALSTPRQSGRSWLTKSPTMHVDATWPIEYIKASTAWQSYTVLCCRRSPREVWQSGLKKWPGWNERYSFREFESLHATYYDQARQLGWQVVDHRRMKQDGQEEVNAVTAKLGWPKVVADPFIVRTPSNRVGIVIGHTTKPRTSQSRSG